MGTRLWLCVVLALAWTSGAAGAQVLQVAPYLTGLDQPLDWSPIPLTTIGSS